ncbi:hypothetical protein DL546_007032 [Coniochaeta pulveracea]|uniref:Uncharacterized protein n=1 Tax=Coniochaeta pulveracea TaxID=177199 RepID=A0A420YE04_9PEZI|nr:hypothetical protein DL546_007032 [Coniochaeta pulveracea]
MPRPRSTQQPHPLGSHPPSQEDLDAVDKALEILALDDRTYCEPMFSFVQARIQGLQEVLDVLARSGRWVPALSDEELDDLVVGLANKKAPAEVLEEIRRRYVHPRFIKKGQKQAAEESNLEHWEKRAAEMTEYMVGRGSGQGSQTPVEMHYTPPVREHITPLAQQQYHPPIQRDQHVAALRDGSHINERCNAAVGRGEGSTRPTSTETCALASPFSAYEAGNSGHAGQDWAPRGLCMGCHDRQQQPSSSSVSGMLGDEGHPNAVKEEQLLPNTAGSATGAPYRAIYVYARAIPNPGLHSSALEGTGTGNRHRQAVVPPPQTPTWSETTIEPQTHLMREASGSLHIGSPSPLPSFFTDAVANVPSIQPNTEPRKVGRGDRKQPPAPLKLTEGRMNPMPKNSAQKPSVQRTRGQQVQRSSAPRSSVPGSSAPRVNAQQSSAGKPITPKRNVPKSSGARTSALLNSLPQTTSPKNTAPETSAQKNNVTSKDVQRNSEQKKGVQNKTKWR